MAQAAAVEVEPKHVTLTCHGMLAKASDKEHASTHIPQGMEVRFYAEEGDEFMVGDGTYLWNTLCASDKLDYESTLKDNKTPSVKMNGKHWTGEYGRGVFLKRAAMEKDKFDDGIYFHAQKMDKDAKPNYKLEQVKGFDKESHGGYVSLENALKFIRAECDGKEPIVVHCMHCLVNPADAQDASGDAEKKDDE